jgi:hypothetical protein
MPKSQRKPSFDDQDGVCHIRTEAQSLAAAWDPCNLGSIACALRIPSLRDTIARDDKRVVEIVVGLVRAASSTARSQLGLYSPQCDWYAEKESAEYIEGQARGEGTVQNGERAKTE